MFDTPRNSTAFIVLNPVAGLVNAHTLKRLIEHRFHNQGWSTRVHITEAEENTTGVVSEELKKGVDLVVAVGGDGTIAAVAAGMVHSHVPLGIIPTGTWNAIARNLQIPFNPIRAVNLMTGKHNLKKLDLMSVGNSIHAMNLGVGFSATMVKNTARGEKRKLGNLAYFSNVIKQVFGLQLRRYTIEADGVRYRGRATEVFVANYGVVGLNAIENLLEIKPDDGKVDILVLRARTILDLPSLFWEVFIKRQKKSPKYRRIEAVQSITIRTTPPLTVQADGELIGETPVKITVLPRAVRVIVPSPPATIQIPKIPIIKAR
jgi:YegS/Rv2252/BmrU family lipid kinase